MKKVSILILFISIFIVSAFSQNKQNQKKQVIMVIDTVTTKTDTITIKPVLDTAMYIPHAVGIEWSWGYINKWSNMGSNFGLIGMDYGLRYTWNFLPYVGWDVIKLRLSANIAPDISNSTQFGFGALSGIRFATPCWGKHKSTNFYTAFRFGAAYYINRIGNYDNDDFYTYNSFGFTWELNLGFHFKHFFLDLFKYSYIDSAHYFGFGMGVDIGKRKPVEYGKKK